MKRSFLMIALTTALLVGACGHGERTDVASSAATTVPTPTVVSIKDFLYHPDGSASAPFVVKAGDAITFRNDDGQAHTATSDTSGVFDTDSIAAGTTAKPVVITTAGTYAYHCSFHPFMHGTIVVQ